MKTLRLWFGLAVVLMGLLSGSISAAATKTAATEDTLMQLAAIKNLSTTGGATVTILTASVPAGSWIISGTASLVNFGPSDYTRCQVVAGSTQVGASTTMVGNPGLAGGQGPAAYVANLTATGPVTSSVPFTASFNCWHDHDTPIGAGPPYVDGGASLWVHLSAGLVAGLE